MTTLETDEYGEAHYKMTSPSGTVILHIVFHEANNSIELAVDGPIYLTKDAVEDLQHKLGLFLVGKIWSIEEKKVFAHEQ